METLELIGLMALFIFVLVSIIMFKRIYVSYSKVMSVGGAYLIAVSMVGIVGLLVTLFSGKALSAITEVIVFLVIAAIGIVKFIAAESRCVTTKQRIFLPIAAIMLAFGISWKFVIALVTHSSLDLPDAGNDQEEAYNPVKEHEEAHNLNNMPSEIYDDNNRKYILQGVYGDHADYRSADTGETVTIYHTSISGTTANTNLGNFHWW